MDKFPRTLAAIHNGIERRLHKGVQLYVSVACNTVVNAGIGEATPDRPLNEDAIMLWRSAGKPLTAAVMLLFAERRLLSLDAPCGKYVPATSASGLGDVSIRNFLTHQSGLPLIDTDWPNVEWDAIIKNVSRLVPGDPTAAYQPQVTWFLLAEILQKVDPQQRTFNDLIGDEILGPLDMAETWCGLPETIAAKSDRLPVYHKRDKGQLTETVYHQRPWLTAPSPGGNFRGPVRQLGIFYEMLLKGGTCSSGEQLLAASTVKDMTSRHREGLYDTTLAHVVDFGLGIIVDSNQHGSDSVPYGFGRYSSSRAFGHGGAQCAMGFCDPDHGLVVAWAANGFCSEGMHQRRNRAINEAIYEDLALV